MSWPSVRMAKSSGRSVAYCPRPERTTCDDRDAVGAARSKANSSSSSPRELRSIGIGSNGTTDNKSNDSGSNGNDNGTGAIGNESIATNHGQGEGTDD